MIVFRSRSIRNWDTRVFLHKDMNVERIKLMEERFDRVSDAVTKLSEALEAYRSEQDELSILNSYYGSDEWKQDFADDEAGRLPKDLKRGVLSEDGVWDVLSENQVLLVRMRELLRATAYDLSQE